MPRVVKEDDYAARRNEILDVTRQAGLHKRIRADVHPGYSGCS